MFHILTSGNHGVIRNSLPLQTALANEGCQSSSRIGFGDESFSHDCVIVERTVGGKHLRYAAVVLGSAPARSRQDLKDLFVLLDETVVVDNP